MGLCATLLPPLTQTDRIRAWWIWGTRGAQFLSGAESHRGFSGALEAQLCHAAVVVARGLALLSHQVIWRMIRLIGICTLGGPRALKAYDDSSSVAPTEFDGAPSQELTKQCMDIKAAGLEADGLSQPCEGPAERSQPDCGTGQDDASSSAASPFTCRGRRGQPSPWGQAWARGSRRR